jgi:hypothetical protein
MLTLKPPRRDVTNTQWQQFTSEWHSFLTAQSNFRTSVTAQLNSMQAKLDQVVNNTAPVDPPTA